MKNGMITKRILYIIVLMQLSCLLSFGQQLRLGIITDYKTFDNFNELAEQLQGEIQKTVGQSNKVEMLPGNLVSSGSTLQEASQNYINLS